MQIQPLSGPHMDRHATLARAHLQFLHFPDLREQVAMKSLTVTEDWLVAHKGLKSPLESVFQPHCSGAGISSSSTGCLHRYPA